MSTNHTLNNNIQFSANPCYFQLQFQTIQFCWVVTFISHTKWPFSSDNTVKYELGWEIGFQEYKRFNFDIFQYAGWCWTISQNNLYLISDPWLTILHPSGTMIDLYIETVISGNFVESLFSNGPLRTLSTTPDLI